MKLFDLFDPHLFAQAQAEGHIRQQTHPTEPLAILNYTKKAAHEGVWHAVTLACRGLVYNTDTMEIVARPLVKFFNYGQAGAAHIPLDTPVQVTDKLDGCFPRQTALNLWGGGTITIGEVVRKRLSVTLVGMDERGNLVPAMVTDWHDNGPKDHWLDVEVDAPVSRISGAGGHANRLRVTVNHHIWVNGEYQPACDIRPGDKIVSQTWRPSGEVIRMVRASLLGDGCLTASATKPGRARYQESHSSKQDEYVMAMRKALGDCAATRSDSRSGYGSKMVWAGSREYEALGDMRSEWYVDGVKRVPSDLSWLDDFAVAKWLMDDGCLHQIKGQAGRICFSTHSFPREDIERLGARLAELYGITYHLSNDKGRGLVLVVNSGRQQQIMKLWRAISPHVHPSMRYKLPAAFRDVPYEEMTPGREETVARSATVRSVTPVEVNGRNFPHGRTGYDITTSTRNYLARGILVHNSLGILYQVPSTGEWAVATRGSFTSEQAQHATALYNADYLNFRPVQGWTYLMEIVYPGNRIVVDYGQLDALVLLGAVDIVTGWFRGPDEIGLWPGPEAEIFDYPTLAHALAAPPRPNAEGFVVRDLDTDSRVKLKQSDYVALHRIVTGLNARVVWQHLMDGKPLADLIAPLPDEFAPWVQTVADTLAAAVDQGIAEIDKVYAEILDQMPAGYTRGDFARLAVQHACRPGLFLKLDGRDPRPELLKHLKPEPGWTPSGRLFTEETA